MRPSLASLRAAAAIAAIAVAGCAPTYAPPPRAAHGGAPGHARPDQSEVRGTLAAPAGGSGGLLLPLGGRAHLELGAEGSDRWVLGTAGLRLSALEEHFEDGRLLGDVGFGGAIGRGGELCGNDPQEDASCDGTAPGPDGLDWHHRLAYGGYLNGGIALEANEWFVPFARGSMRLSAATHVPLTFWLSGMAGIELRFEPIAFYFGGGWWGYTNEYDSKHGPLLELGLAVRFGGAQLGDGSPQRN